MKGYAARMAAAARAAYAAGDDLCPLEMMDATWEDANGRLPHEPGYVEPMLQPKPVPEPVPELIPEWVLADAREMRTHGMAMRKIATAVLPATGCADIPSCEELLKLQLEPAASRPTPTTMRRAASA